jgi:hypothetical protein
MAKGSMKKSTKILMGIGGAAALVGVGYLLWRKFRPGTSAPERMNPAAIVTSRTAKPTRTGSRSVSRTTSPTEAQFLAIGEKRARGWLGAIFAHGGASLAYEIHYLQAHDHLLPSCAGVWDSVEGGGTMKIDYSRKTLMTRHFMEWQCPAFDSQSPCFSKMDKGVEGDDWRDAIEQVVTGEGKENYWLEVFLKNDVRHPGAKMSSGDRPANAVFDWIMWTITRDHQATDRQLDHGLQSLAPYMTNKVQPSSYWGKSESTRKEWGKRLIRWYWTAQFAIWSLEMLRLHSGFYMVQPTWWRDYCTAWGIGMLKFGKFRETYVLRGKSKDDPMGYNLETKMGTQEWTKFAEYVMSQAGLPGQPGFLGEQIADAGKTRHIFDIPPELGAAVPPIYIVGGKWNQSSASWWLNHSDISNFWTDTFLPIWNAAIGLLASAVGSSAFNAAFAAVNTAYQAGVAAMRAFNGIMNGNIGDATELVYQLGQCAAAVGAAAGSDVVIPDNLWSQIKDYGKEITGISGSMAGEIRKWAEYARSTLEVAEKYDKYGYLDDLVGGLVDDSK